MTNIYRTKTLANGEIHIFCEILKIINLIQFIFNNLHFYMFTFFTKIWPFICTYLQTFICTSVHFYTYICKLLYVHLYTFICTSVHIYMYIFALLYVYLHTFMCIHLSTFTCTSDLFYMYFVHFYIKLVL